MNPDLVPNEVQKEFLLGILFLIAAYFLFRSYLDVMAEGIGRVVSAMLPNLERIAA